MKLKIANPETRTYDESEVEYYREHPDQIPLYIEVAFEESVADGDWGAFLLSVRAVVEAQGGMAKLAKELGCSRTSLYKTLSEEGNPRLDTIAKILKHLGFALGVKGLEPEKKKKKK